MNDKSLESKYLELTNKYLELSIKYAKLADDLIVAKSESNYTMTTSTETSMITLRDIIGQDIAEIKLK